MERHRFATGDVVVYKTDNKFVDAPRGDYKITRLLPLAGSGIQYRIKHVFDGHERVVNETDLSVS
jgi:hypothetical protein